MTIEGVRLAVINFFRTVLVDTNLIYLEIWHFVHFILAFFVMYLIGFVHEEDKKRWVLMAILILGYEFFEAIWITMYPGFFGPESRLDIIYDIVLGFLGAWTYMKWKNRKKK